MKLLNILEKLGDKSFSFSEEKNESRRESIFKIGSQGKDFLKVALPTGVMAGLASTEAKAGNSGSSGTTDVAGVLQFALKLEYLESQFYTNGISSAAMNGATNAEKAVFNQIKKHEAQHVAFLKSAITSLGVSPIAEPTFDFTANGAFDPWTSYSDFLALSQAFEDTGVRAYKGQAANLMSNDAILQAALQIHAVEARHASQVRRIRNSLLNPQKGWISNNDRGNLPSATQPIYNGEDNTSQGGIDAVGATTVGAAYVREAFDEPLSQSEVEAIVALFV